MCWNVPKFLNFLPMNYDNKNLLLQTDEVVLQLHTVKVLGLVMFDLRHIHPVLLHCAFLVSVE